MKTQTIILTVVILALAAIAAVQYAGYARGKKDGKAKATPDPKWYDEAAYEAGYAKAKPASNIPNPGPAVQVTVPGRK